MQKMNKQLDEDEGSSDDDSDTEYEGSSDEDRSEDESEYEDEEKLEDNLVHENDLQHMDIPGESYKPIRNGRGPTKMKRMWKEHDANSKIQLKFNRFGQPCGLKTCKLTSFIGYLVRGKEIPLTCSNWSKIEKSLKDKLWKTVQGFFHIDETYKTWVLKSASKKWKDFKAVLKRKFFDPKLSRRQNISNGCANRIPEPQWIWLVNHWMSNESQELKEGRKIGRAELYIATHTRRNGKPIDDYSSDKIDEIRRGFEDGPSLIAEEIHDNDFFSSLFPNERVGKRRGLGLLAGSMTSERIFEALAEVQETKEENKKLWSVVQTLMSNQTKLEQQYDELKSQVSASQRCPSIESSPKVVPVPRDHLQAMSGVAQVDSIVHPNNKPRTEPEERRKLVVPSQHKTKSSSSQPTVQQKLKEKPSTQSLEKKVKNLKEKPSLQSLEKKLKERPSPQSLEKKVKKPRKFQAPLNMDEMQGIKCGMEVGLASPNSKKMVAMGTVQRTDSKAKGSDGYPLADCVDVLITVVFNQMTMLPRAHGKIQKLGNATARCIAWPRENIMKLNVHGPSQIVTKKSAGNVTKENSKKRDAGPVFTSNSYIYVDNEGTINQVR